MIIHLEPDILECEVKWALGSIATNKASRGDGIPVELFQILKDDVKVLHSILQQIWKTHQWPQDWKRSVFIPIPKKGNVKECSNYVTIALIWHTSKVMLKIRQASLQQYLKCELREVQVELRKGRGTRDQIANIHLEHWRNKRVPEIHLLLLYWLHQSLWLCGSQQTCKFFKRWKYQIILPASWEICMQAKKQQFELDMEQEVVPNWERSTSRLYVVTLFI